MSQTENRLFEGKRILVTGGTGSIGKIIAKNLLEQNVEQIIVLSRDEQKHFALQHEFENHPKIRTMVGDVRDARTLNEACRGIDIVFHAAAMKHVPICEEDPMETVKTNVLGAYNLREIAIENKVDKVIVVSTDKAVRPINVMGMTKALQERIMLADHNHNTTFIGVRFGNVLGSKGSIIPLFRQKIQEGKPLPLTNPNMTRFFMPTQSAVDLLLHATSEGKHGEIFVKKMPVCNIKDLTDAIIKVYAPAEDYPIDIVGVRKGEQIYESLVSDEEMRRVSEFEDYFVIAPAWTPEKKETPGIEYNSEHAAEKLSPEDLVQMLHDIEADK